MLGKQEHQEYLHASTQYEDCKGDLCVDGHDSPPLHTLAEELGVDTKKYFPVSIHVSFGTYDEESKNCSVTFFVVDIEQYGPNYDNILKAAKADSSRLKVSRLESISVELGTVLKHAKRVELVLGRKELAQEKIKLWPQ